MSYRIVLSILTLWGLMGCNNSSGTEETVAVGDRYHFANSGLLNVGVADGVLKNDQGEELLATLISEPSSGEGFIFSNDGSFSYTAHAESDTVFTDQFEYQIKGKDDLAHSALVTITVYPKPESVADQYRIYVGQANDVTREQGVLANDKLSRIDSRAEVRRMPTQADSFVLNSDGSFSYTAKPSADGVDDFSYVIHDDLQSGDEQEVELVIETTVFSGQDDSFQVESGRILRLQPLQGLLKNDDGLSDISVVVQQRPLHAIDFSISPSGMLTYRTVSETAGQDSFSYALHKNTQMIGPFTVDIDISQPIDAAVAPWLYDQCKEYQAGESIDGVLSAVSVEGANFKLVSAPRFGVLTAFDGSSGQFSYMRSTSHRGQDAFSYRIFDAVGDYVADASQELIAIPYRIMPVGDSITSGVELYDTEISADTPSSDKRVGYRKFLHNELTSLGYSVDLVGSRNEGYNVAGFTDSQHNGYPGVSDDFISTNIVQWLDTTGADIILMHIGTNATKSHIGHISSIGTKIENWEKREDNPVTWMMAKLIARTDTTAGGNAIRRFNGLIEDYVDQRIVAGDRIHLVDQYTALGGEAGRYLSADQLHPQAEGYQLMSDKWIKRLQETRAIAKCL